jgi:hypothetical protein
VELEAKIAHIEEILAAVSKSRAGEADAKALFIIDRLANLVKYRTYSDVVFSKIGLASIPYYGWELCEAIWPNEVKINKG